MNPLKEFVYRLRGEHTTERLVSMGMHVGKDFKRLKGVILDPSHCWLIDIGDRVTMAPAYTSSAMMPVPKRRWDTPRSGV